MTEKKGDLAQKINSVTQGEFESLFIRYRTCPECVLSGAVSNLVRKEEELVCTRCGLVIGEERFINNIPFGRDSQMPGNQLAFNHGYGDTLQLKGLWALIAKDSKTGFKCPKCGVVINDLPIRARQTQIMSQRHEHPRIATLLRFASQRCKDFGFDKSSGDTGLIVSNYFGKMVRRVGAHAILSGTRMSPSRLTDCVFAFVLRDLKGQAAFEDARTKLGLDDQTLHNVGVVYEVIPK